MGKLLRNKEDIRNIQNLMIIILVLKIIGIIFIRFYSETGRTREGLIYREQEVIQQKEISPVMLALGYHWDSIHYVNTSIY